jgi:hypothetical protein
MVKYLGEEEKIESRKIYEAVFNDTKKFLDYYYENRLSDNLIIMGYHGNTPVSTMHLIPKKFIIKNQEYMIYYIYGVATLEEFRKQGYLKEMMEKALFTLKEKNVPLVYLIPEDPLVYHKYGFVTVREKQEELVKLEKKEYYNSTFSIKEMTLADVDEAVSFSKRKIKADFFRKRDKDFFLDMMLRQKAENGSLELFYVGDELAGYGCVSNEQEFVISEILCDQRQEFLSLIMKKYGKEEIKLRVPEIMVKILKEEGNENFEFNKEFGINTILMNEIV